MGHFSDARINVIPLGQSDVQSRPRHRSVRGEYSVRGSVRYTNQSGVVWMSKEFAAPYAR